MSHTPGPWKYEIGIPDAKTGELCNLITADGIVLADVNDRHEDGYIIAAAPELYDAVNAAIAFYEWHMAAIPSEVLDELVQRRAELQRLLADAKRKAQIV